jgi:cytochrome c biogenesis protein CcmG/thiol:disulfide interchange protein DsbE
MSVTGEAPAVAPRNPWRRRLLLLAPLGVAIGAGVGFFAMLRGLGRGSYNPRGVPSALIGKPPPDFTLPPLEGAERPALAATDLRGAGKPVLVNFFASWCLPCVIEHPQLMRLAREGVPLEGATTTAGVHAG